jgi:hypothetical protein
MTEFSFYAHEDDLWEHVDWTAEKFNADRAVVQELADERVLYEVEFVYDDQTKQCVRIIHNGNTYYPEA